MNLTTRKLFEDGTHILYVNGEYRDDSDIGKLMHDFNCTDADDMNFTLLAEKTRYLKENPKGVHEMCKVMEDLRNESYFEGFEKGELKKSKEIAISLAKDGVKIEKIASLIKVSESTIKEWLS